MSKEHGSLLIDLVHIGKHLRTIYCADSMHPTF